MFAAGLDNFWSTLALPEPASRPLQGRARALSRAARSGRRTRRRNDRRRRRTRAGTALPAAGRTAGGDRRALRRTARAARPGRLVAVALPASHREARPRAPEGRRRGARPQPAPAAGSEDRARLLGGDALGVRGRALCRGARRGRRLDAGRGARRPGGVARGRHAGARRRRRRRTRRKSIERWREEAGRNARAASGWEQTLEAASDGRVELLLFQKGVDHPAFRCPACGRAAIEGGSCPLDGTRLEATDAGLDLAVHQTLAHGGAVWAIRHQRGSRARRGHRRAAAVLARESCAFACC